jgi:hypothetical protein
VLRDKPISAFAQECDAGNVLIEHQEPLGFRTVVYQMKHRFGSAQTSAVRKDQPDRFMERFSRDLRVSVCRFLRRGIFDASGRKFLPVSNPD